MIGALGWHPSATRTLEQALSNRPETSGGGDSVLLGCQPGVQDGATLSSTAISARPQTEKREPPESLTVPSCQQPESSPSVSPDAISYAPPEPFAEAPNLLTDKDSQVLSSPDTEPPDHTLDRLRREASDRYCEELGGWARRLTHEKPDPQELHKVCEVLARMAAEAPFPMARHVARTLVQEYGHWDDPVVDWSAKRGAVEGPTYYLQTMSQYFDTHTDKVNYAELNGAIPEFVEALDKACATRAVPQNALKAVTHSASIWRHRAETVTDEEVRKHESVDFDVGLSNKCASLVEKWWRNGQVRVLLDEKPVAPSFDVRKAICAERVAVRDGAIHLRTNPPDPPADVRKQAEQIETDLCNSTDSKNLGALRDLAHNDFARAVAVVAAMLQRAEQDRGGLEGLAIGLQGAADDESLRNVFRPFLPRLAMLVSEADARGRLTRGEVSLSHAHADLLGGLVEAFPEAIDANMVTRELGPLLLHTWEPTIRDSEVAKRLMEKRPDLTAAVAKCITSAEEVKYSSIGDLLVEAAAKRGWVPDDEQVDWLARRLWVPTGKKKLSVFFGSARANGFRAAVNVLNVFKKSHPEILDEIRLPDMQFHTRPLREVLFDRIYNDPSDGVIYYLRDADFDVGVTAGEVYRLTFPDAKLTRALLSKVRRDFEAGRHIRPSLQPGNDCIGLDAQKALMVLTSIDLDDEERNQLQTMVRPELYHPSLDSGFSPLLEPLRKKTRDEALDRLDQTPQSAPETFATASDILTLLRSSDDARRNPRSVADTNNTLVASIQNAFGKLPLGALAAERDRRFKILEERLSQRGLEYMSERELADTQLLAVCAGLDPTFGEVLRAALLPYCHSHVGDAVVGELLHTLREVLREKDLGRLRTPDLGRADRAAQVKAIIEQAKTDREDHLVEPRVISAAVDGVRHTRGVDDLPDFFATPEEAYEFYGRLAPNSTDDKAIAAEWARVRDVFVYMGGPQVIQDKARRRKAIELSRFVEERVATGEPRDKALQHALMCYFNNRDPRTTPEYDEEARRKEAGGVVTHERSVTIGNVVVPRNVDPSA